MGRDASSLFTTIAQQARNQCLWNKSTYCHGIPTKHQMLCWSAGTDCDQNPLMRTGGEAQRQSTCPAFARLWVPSPAPQNKTTLLGTGEVKSGASWLHLGCP
jgi:hypothetical protein